MRRDALLEQLNLIHDGTVYVYGPGEPGNAGPPAPPGRPLAAAPWSEASSGLIHPEDLDRAQRHREQILKLPDRAVATSVLRMRHPDGAWRWIEIREQVIERDGKGAPQRILGLASDVSELRRLRASVRSASEALLNAEARERRRIARELHDSMAQHLVAIDLTLSRLERHASGQLEPAIMSDLHAALAAAHRDARTFSYLLHPPDLERLGLEEALRRFLDGFAARTGLAVRLRIEQDLPPVGSLGELSLFRVAQEALMNVHKHAAASTVEVALAHAPEGVALEVGDDGIGLGEAEVALLMDGGAGGVGLAAMRARMRQVDGDLEVLSTGRGVKIRAVAPIDRDLPKAASNAAQ